VVVTKILPFVNIGESSVLEVDYARQPGYDNMGKIIIQ
jgi:hypothetical protein